MVFWEYSSFIIFLSLNAGAILSYISKNEIIKENLYIKYQKQIFNDKPIEYSKNRTILNSIDKIFKETGKININNFEYKIQPSENMVKKNKAKNIINIGFTLDPGYILETMFTMGNIMATQNSTTKIIFHLGVVYNFKAKYMLKIYELKSKINNLTEFNFYILKNSMKKMHNFHPKGDACPGKFELPYLLPENVEKLIIFDAGDILVFRDLSDLFNYNISDWWVLGVPEPSGINFIKKYNRFKYINIGSMLLNVKELKKTNFFDIYTNNRYLKILGAKDQTLFNIVSPDDKKNFLPFKFGGFSILQTDKESEEIKFIKTGYDNWLIREKKNIFQSEIKTEIDIICKLFNPYYIHAFSGKWFAGQGLSIYRHLAKYFIKLTDIWDELCEKSPGYCV